MSKSDKIVNPMRESSSDQNEKTLTPAMQMLLKKISEDQDLLLNWVSGPNSKDDFKRFIQQVKSLGGAEGISYKLHNVMMDTDLDGIVTPEELEASKEKREAKVNDTLNLLINIGVVSGLIVSVLYSVVLSPLIASSESESFFGHDFIQFFSYMFYAAIYTSLAISLALIWKSVRFYIAISVWMEDIDMKTWFLNSVSMVPMITASSVSVSMLAVAFPFGVLVNVSPGAGLVATTFIGVTLFMVVYTDFTLRYSCLDQQYDRVKAVLSTKIIKK
eukprot:gene11808-15802_t